MTHPTVPAVWPRLLQSLRLALTGLALSLAAISAPSAAEQDGMPTLYTHQKVIEDAMKVAPLDLKDHLAVFEFVLKSLPARVKVYPTENYFYFWFYQNHVKISGNIRLDPTERADGQVNFAFFEDYTEWATESDINFHLLGPNDGVKVEKIEELVYKISFRGTEVIFELNDLSNVKPPEGFLRDNEVFIGPTEDDSGIQFYLVWNKAIKNFHYILNEQAPVTDQFRSSTASPRIVVGKRTGFAFYRDRYKDRKILIGVFEGNTAVNNYFDGPFDQLPDNFIKDDTLQKAILELEPGLKGKIDKYGNSPGGKERYLIGPYTQYRSEDELAVVERCTKDRRVKGERYYGCFVITKER